SACDSVAASPASRAIERARRPNSNDSLSHPRLDAIEARAQYATASVDARPVDSASVIALATHSSARVLSPTVRYSSHTKLSTRACASPFPSARQAWTAATAEAMAPPVSFARLHSDA